MHHSKKRGLTLVETLISLFVLSLAITGAFAAFRANLASATSIRDSYIASGLAQEGIEVVRNLRDTDWFAVSTPKFGALGDASGNPVADGTYCVQWNSTQLSTVNCDARLIRSDMGLFAYDIVGTPTPFVRSIQIIKGSVLPSGSIGEITIKVSVSWSERANAKQIIAEEHLFNWH